MPPLVIPEPSVLLGAVLAGWLYWRGLRRVWLRAGRERGVKSWQVGCFVTGLAALLVALESPLDSLSEALFAAHMVQHLLLILAAGPLLVLGAPMLPFLWAVPPSLRPVVGALFRGAAWAARPPLAFALHSLALWAWHVPSLYEAALANRAIHVLEHLSFLLTAILFWWALLHHGRAAYGLAVLYVFGLAVQSTILGAVLTFAPNPWYSSHLTTSLAYGVAPLEDQQLAGLIMWVPAGGVYLAAALALFAAWLRQDSGPDRTPDPAARTPVRR